MSDDATIRIGPEQPPRRRVPGRDGSVIGGVVAALILAGFVALGDASPGRDAAAPGEAPAATVTEVATGASTSAPDVPSDAPPGAPTDAFSAPTQPLPPPSEAGVRRPRALDVRAFLSAYDARHGPGLEIGTRQSTGTEGSSVSLWGLVDGRWARESADGGCWDGSHTYGATGAVVQPGRIAATCDASDVPRGASPSDVYVWDGSAWAYRETVEPGD